MFNRRMLVALAACLAISASSAMAGGGGGTKKNSTIEVHNKTNHVVYAFVDVSDQKIQTASGKPTPEAILAAFKQLGGKQIDDPGSASFKVAAGDHNVTVVAIDVEDEQLIGRAFVNVPKGATSVVEIEDLFNPQAM